MQGDAISKTMDRFFFGGRRYKGCGPVLFKTKQKKALNTTISYLYNIKFCAYRLSSTEPPKHNPSVREKEKQKLRESDRNRPGLRRTESPALVGFFSVSPIEMHTPPRPLFSCAAQNRTRPRKQGTRKRKAVEAIYQQER